MPKWKLYIWKLWHNTLATKSNLFRRGIGVDALCPVCLYDEESLTHLFRQCSLASEAWELHWGRGILDDDPHRTFQE